MCKLINTRFQLNVRLLYFNSLRAIKPPQKKSLFCLNLKLFIIAAENYNETTFELNRVFSIATKSFPQ